MLQQFLRHKCVCGVCVCVAEKTFGRIPFSSSVADFVEKWVGFGISPF